MPPTAASATRKQRKRPGALGASAALSVSAQKAIADLHELVSTIDNDDRDDRYFLDVEIVLEAAKKRLDAGMTADQLRAAVKPEVVALRDMLRRHGADPLTVSETLERVNAGLRKLMAGDRKVDVLAEGGRRRRRQGKTHRRRGKRGRRTRRRQR